MRKRSVKKALLVLDMLSDFGFPQAAGFERAARIVARRLPQLLARARKARVPIIYVNDTRGVWESDQRAFVARCLAGPGADIAAKVRPQASDFFMFKPKHSAFYGTPLAELLYLLKVRHVVITGISSHQCVLLTASDAHVRGLAITIATDCVAAPQAVATRHALYVMQHGLDASISRSEQVRF